MAPADVEEIVPDAEEGDGLEGQEAGKIGCQLHWSVSMLLKS